MKSQISNKLKKLSPLVSWIIASVGALVLIASVVYGVYRYDLLEKDRATILSELADAKYTYIDLLQKSRDQQAIIDTFQGQISNIGNTVGTLEKLAATDEELLKKYSKIYFLNENYRPAKLATIDQKYLYNKDEAYIQTQVLPFLKKLLEAARADGIELLVASAFRSFDAQAVLKSEYKVIYGAGTANQFSADQGYSEHQLGTALDFTTPDVGGMFSTFEKDPAYAWLQNNAHKYGFILSYPQDNAYYKFEPWHWRFVGADLAKRLYIDREYFYDLGQREIDEYLIKLFD